MRPRLKCKRWLPGIFRVYQGKRCIGVVWRDGSWWRNNHEHVTRGYRKRANAAKALR